MNPENIGQPQQGGQDNKSDQRSQQPGQVTPGQKQAQQTQQPAGQPGKEAKS